IRACLLCETNVIKGRQVVQPLQDNRRVINVSRRAELTGKFSDRNPGDISASGGECRRGDCGHDVEITKFAGSKSTRDCSMGETISVAADNLIATRSHHRIDRSSEENQKTKHGNRWKRKS